LITLKYHLRFGITFKFESLWISDGNMIKVIFLDTEAIPRGGLDGKNS